MGWVFFSSEPGGPHYNCPDKLPQARLATVAAAGAARVPFTSGLLVGLGETEQERVDALLALRDLHAQYGHLQVCAFTRTLTLAALTLVYQANAHPKEQSFLNATQPTPKPRRS
jgi:2-iminoacetate synthase ThiH